MGILDKLLSESVISKVNMGAESFNVLRFINNYKYIFIMLIIVWAIVVLVLYNIVFTTPEEKEAVYYNNSILTSSVIVIMLIYIVSYSYNIISPAKSGIKEGVKKLFNKLIE